LLWFEKIADNAGRVAALVQRAISALQIPHEKSELAENVTVSMGIYIVRCGASSYDMRTLYDQADKAMYAAKNDGRNRAVISFGEAP